MEYQDQNPIEASDSRMSDSTLERKENNTRRPYHAPHVFLVGKAKQLMTGGPMGIAPDVPNDGGWHDL